MTKAGDTLEVLEAVGSKWNFLPFPSGLVGGHCIGVAPYYLTHKAQEIGFHPEFMQMGAAGIHALGKLGHVLYDVKSMLNKAEADGRL
jgi:UDP-N-acetyl-D-galactosamine dehydrogenase